MHVQVQLLHACAAIFVQKVKHVVLCAGYLWHILEK